MNPFTVGHLLLVNKLLEEAKKRGAEHKMYLSKTQDKKKNPLSIEKKIFWARKSAPGVNFVAADDKIRTFIEAVIAQSGKYDHLVLLAGSDRVPGYKELLNKYNGTEFNFKTVEVVSAGERDPDADGAAGMSATKLRLAASNNNFNLFKSGVSSHLSDSDARKMMKDIRDGMGIKPVEESMFKISSDRERFYQGKVFKIGQIVKEGSNLFEILDRGSNYVVVCNESGELQRKFTAALEIVEDSTIPYKESGTVSFKGYVPGKNFLENRDAVSAFQDTIQRYNEGKIHDAVAILRALQNTSLMFDHINMIVDRGEHPGAHEVVNGKILEHYAKLRESLMNIGEFEHHLGYLQPIMSLVNYAEAEPGSMDESMETPIIKSSDKLKVAKIIADALGVDVPGSNPEQLVNAALRSLRSKALKADSLAIIGNMLSLAKEVGVKFDENLVPKTLREEAEPENDAPITFKHLVKKVSKSAEEADEDDEEPEHEEHQKVGHSYNTSSETHRKQIVKKLKDD
jgi:acyl carrier protein